MERRAGGLSFKGDAMPKPRCCPTEKHEAQKLDRATWEATTEHETPWFVGDGVLFLADCINCLSTICRAPWPGEQTPARAA